ncbi:hypothetical protein [Cryobacterium sp. TMB1-7]|uniref:hypothetical protein n=1 Tax=Cryobacterium sp. TMB1-7 TaxID=2555866 RepID=UPI00106994A9|nr:hypothetical protein [Cryobacterium sp. TMB1-7]TFC63100.1 hypothetical protein E3O60_00830 [Cryobacterium sp. TMB1-7]
MELTNREMATLILIGVAGVALLLLTKDRHGILASVWDLLRAFLQGKILILVALYIAYATGLIMLASLIGLWELGMLKDTIVTALFVGLPLVFNAHKVRSGAKLVRSVVAETLGVAALIALYLSLSSLSIGGELILQFAVIVLSLLSVVGKRKPETRVLALGCDFILGLIGIAMGILATVTLVSTWAEIDSMDLARSVGLSIWLPLLLLPFVYVLAVWMSAERVLTILPWHNHKVDPPLRVKAAFIIGVHFSAFYASNFTGLWLGRLARQTTFRAARAEMRSYRANIRQNVALERERVERLGTLAGVAGADENGLRLDRREFAATKKVLRQIFYMQMGWHRNRLGRFRSDIIDVLGDVTKDGLPAPHGIHHHIRNDSQAWYAWRETPGGRFFGIGGHEDLSSEWQYDGDSPPASFPGLGSGWNDATRNPSRPEWGANDDPIRVR